MSILHEVPHLGRKKQTKGLDLIALHSMFC